MAFLATVQNVSNPAFPNIDAALSANGKPTDAVCQTLSEHLILTQNQAHRRMKTRKRKPLLASGILDSIKKFCGSAEFAGRPDKIRECALWLL